MGTPNQDVIVIGAGIAGLSAAVQLSKTDLEFVILEARERIGGRIYPIQLKDGRRFHLGANWIHASHDENPLANYLRQYEIFT